MLLKFKEIIQQKKIVSLEDASQLLHVSPAILANMAEHFIRKGYAQWQFASKACKFPCNSCSSKQQNVIEWKEKK